MASFTEHVQSDWLARFVRAGFDHPPQVASTLPNPGSRCPPSGPRLRAVEFSCHLPPPPVFVAVGTHLLQRACCRYKCPHHTRKAQFHFQLKGLTLFFLLNSRRECARLSAAAGVGYIRAPPRSTVRPLLFLSSEPLRSPRVDIVQHLRADSNPCRTALSRSNATPQPLVARGARARCCSSASALSNQLARHWVALAFTYSLHEQVFLGSQ